MCTHTHTHSHTQTRILQHAPHASANPFTSPRARRVGLAAHRCAHQLRAGLGGGAHKVPRPLSYCLIPREAQLLGTLGAKSQRLGPDLALGGTSLSQARPRSMPVPPQVTRRGTNAAVQAATPHWVRRGRQGSAFTPVIRTREEEVRELSWYDFHST